jgi:nitrogen regulatory protein PII
MTGAGGLSAVKLVTAVIRPEKLDDVTKVVVEMGARGMTVAEVRGFGQQYGQAHGAHPEVQAGVLAHKLRVEVVVRGDIEALLLADAIAKAVRTGAIGDGKVWICPVEGALRVRTGERDRDAL